MNIKDKIATKEELLVALDTASRSYREELRRLQDVHAIEPSWWAVRENVRIREGLYQVTEALEEVNRHAKVFAHISMVDKTKVAFTPDKAFGERDAQLTMNFGKMVQRVIPFASDEYVKQLTESHTADLSDEVEWIEGPEIANVYAGTRVSSCMTNKTWQMANPALAYDAPGIKMAVLRDSEGDINARCMVYENGEDKRLIRNYGDGRLLKRLTRLGYSFGGWQGVQFRTISTPADHGYVKVAIPYLDCMNGPSRENECSVALIDGVLQGVKYENIRKMKEAGVTVVTPSTAGNVQLRPVSSQDFLKKDLVTGELVNVLFDKLQRVYHLGEYGVTKTENINTEVFVKARKREEDRWESVWMLRTLTFVSRYSDVYFDGDYEREDAGYYKLSPKFYSESSWVHTSAIRIKDTDSSDWIYIKQADGVRVYDGSELLWMHKDQLTKAHTRVADHDGKKYYVTKGVEILRTPSKAKVVVGIHDIREGWKGCDYSRNLQFRVDVFTDSVYCRRAERSLPEFQQYIADKAKACAEAYFKSLEGWTVQKQFSYTVSRSNTGVGYIYPSEGNKSFLRQLYGAGDTIRDMNLDRFKEYLEDFAKARKGNVEHEAAAYYARLAIAEMEAVNGEEPMQQPATLETPKVVIADRFALAA
jgi:hypothetical protein